MMPNAPIMAAKREQAKYYGIEMMPSDRYTQIEQKSGFRYWAAQKYAEISVSDSRFSLCPAGCVLRYNKQGLCVPQKSRSQPKSADSLGAQPPIPRKERCVWGKMFVLPSV